MFIAMMVVLGLAVLVWGYLWMIWTLNIKALEWWTLVWELSEKDPDGARALLDRTPWYVRLVSRVDVFAKAGGGDRD